MPSHAPSVWPDSSSLGGPKRKAFKALAAAEFGSRRHSASMPSFGRPSCTCRLSLLELVVVRSVLEGNEAALTCMVQVQDLQRFAFVQQQLEPASTICKCVVEEQVCLTPRI